MRMRRLGKVLVGIVMGFEFRYRRRYGVGHKMQREDRINAWKGAGTWVV